MGVVFWKELSDHFSSRRFMILLVLILLTGLWAVFSSGQAIRDLAQEIPTEFVFLLLLTAQPGTVFSLAAFLVYCLFRRLLADLDPGRDAGTAAFLVALALALHPVSVYAVSYIGQLELVLASVQRASTCRTRTRAAHTRPRAQPRRPTTDGASVSLSPHAPSRPRPP